LSGTAQHDTELGKQASQAVDQGGALVDPSLTGPVPAQDGLLFDRLDGDESHRGLAGRDRDGFGIAASFLPPLRNRVTNSGAIKRTA
jgi:hypothetical protein